MYRRTRSRKFVIDGEELVRHTEDLISIRDESKTTYAQRVYKLRYVKPWNLAKSRLLLYHFLMTIEETYSLYNCGIVGFSLKSQHCFASYAYNFSQEGSRERVQLVEKNGAERSEEDDGKVER